MEAAIAGRSKAPRRVPGDRRGVQRNPSDAGAGARIQRFRGTGGRRGEGGARAKSKFIAGISGRASRTRPSSDDEGSGPPRATPTRDVGGDRRDARAHPGRRGPRVPTVGAGAHPLRAARRFHRRRRRHLGGERLCLGDARPAEAALERHPRGVPLVDVHRAEPPRQGARDPHRPRGRELGESPRNRRDAAPRVAVRRADLPQGGIRAHNGDAALPFRTASTSPTYAETRSALPVISSGGSTQAFLPNYFRSGNSLVTVLRR